MTTPAPDDDAAPEPDQPDAATASGDEPPPVTAQMLQADPRLNHDVIELTNPNDPDSTYDT